MEDMLLPGSSPEKLAWMAGFWEGEGNIYISRRVRSSGRKGISGHYALKVSVVNTDRELLESFTTFFGGFIATQKSKKIGHKDCYHWILAGGKKAERFIRAILPYLYSSRRRAQLEEGLCFISSTCQKPQGFVRPLDRAEIEQREGHYQRMKTLHV